MIDFGKLEEHIREIEGNFESKGLNQVEQDLVLRQAMSRLSRKIESQKVKDSLNNISWKDMFKQAWRQKDDE